MDYTENNKNYDFDEIYFKTNCNIDEVIDNFFITNYTIIGDKEYVKNKMKKYVMKTRLEILERQKNQSTDCILKCHGLHRFLQHNVISEDNNNKDFYIYSINVFV